MREPPPHKPLTRVDALLMVLVVAYGLFRLAPELAHDSIWEFDESFHQVVTRHTFEHPLSPTLYDDALHDSTDLYWNARAWLIKPPGAFWLGALMMHFTGVAPVAFRLSGLFSQLIAALTLFLLARHVAGRWLAGLVSLGMLSLPMGWFLTQARFIGDELDLILCGCICIAVLAWFRAMATQSLSWAATAGAATGAGFLVKTVLALTPLGVAGCLWLLGMFRFCRGPKLKLVAMMLATAIAVATPWNWYAAHTWPATYRAANADALVHLLESEAAAKAPQWRRPVDAVFNEVNQALFQPTPHALVLGAGVWLVVRAVRKREPVVVGAALWLWATWVGHSMAAIKIHSHLWNAVVPGFLALAVLMHDVWKSPALAFVTGAGLATPALVKLVPSLGRIRDFAPAAWGQSRISPGFLEGLVLMLGALLLGLLVHRAWKMLFRVPFPTLVVALPAVVGLGSTMTWDATAGQAALALESRPRNDVAHSREVGRALDQLSPEKSLLLLDIEQNPYGQNEGHNLMFWSNRLVHRGRNPEDYPQAGYHPYLISPAAEPYAAVPVVAHGWLRAYDMTVPWAGAQPLPEGVTPVDFVVGNLRVLGFAHGRSSRTVDHYAFYVRAEGGAPGSLKLSFQTAKGLDSRVIEPEASLRSRHRLGQAEWFVLPSTGPRFEAVQAIQFGSQPENRVLVRP
jgi:4-amino-4-deoxy-L-arabinose transferase-like glycosyltransferase